MTKPITGTQSQDHEDSTLLTLRPILDAGLDEVTLLRSVVAILANHCFRMDQHNLCFELQAMLLGQLPTAKRP